MDSIHYHGGGKTEYGKSVKHFQRLGEGILSLIRSAHHIQQKGPTNCKSTQNKKDIHQDRVGHVLPQAIEAMMKRKPYDPGRMDLNLGQDENRRIHE